jgi:hypothetical protein
VSPPTPDFEGPAKTDEETADEVEGIDVQITSFDQVKSMSLENSC